MITGDARSAKTGRSLLKMRTDFGIPVSKLYGQHVSATSSPLTVELLKLIGKLTTKTRDIRQLNFAFRFMMTDAIGAAITGEIFFIYRILHMTISTDLTRSLCYLLLSYEALC